MDPLSSRSPTSQPAGSAPKAAQPPAPHGDLAGPAFARDGLELGDPRSERPSFREWEKAEARATEKKAQEYADWLLSFVPLTLRSAFRSALQGIFGNGSQTLTSRIDAGEGLIVDMRKTIARNVERQ